MNDMLAFARLVQPLLRHASTCGIHSRPGPAGRCTCGLDEARRIVTDIILAAERESVLRGKEGIVKPRIFQRDDQKEGDVTYWHGKDLDEASAAFQMQTGRNAEEANWSEVDCLPDGVSVSNPVRVG